ncbi:hypothetical protein NC651_007245 [Populus alba x Populus x berolinensis]|nr:hypothetical protein NC651_007245 [Populus alba x Populus x berolinensis]
MDPAELRRVFQMFDKNGDGQITKKELSDSLKNLGIYIPDKDLIQMIEKIDVNGDGYVDIEEFGALYQTIMDERDEEEDMREAFNVFDQNGDGFITVEELKSVLSSLGLKQGRTLEDCKRMIKKVDVDGDGMVNFREFKQMMKGGGFAALGDPFAGDNCYLLSFANFFSPLEPYADGLRAVKRYMAALQQDLELLQARAEGKVGKRTGAAKETPETGIDGAESRRILSEQLKNSEKLKEIIDRKEEGSEDCRALDDHQIRRSIRHFYD